LGVKPKFNPFGDDNGLLNAEATSASQVKLVHNVQVVVCANPCPDMAYGRSSMRGALDDHALGGAWARVTTYQAVPFVPAPDLAMLIPKNNVATLATSR
jgi:hypothetical protein